MSKFADKLPEASREEVKAFITEGCMVAKTLLLSALNMAYASVRILQSTLITNRTIQLQNLGIAPRVQQTIEDLLMVRFCFGWMSRPFDGQVLFLEKD